jgi:hypothetical protein
MYVALFQISDILSAMSPDKRGGARPNTGPKPKPVEKLRRNRVMLNLTDEEHRELSKAAGGESISSYARRVLIRHLRRRSR